MFEMAPPRWPLFCLIKSVKRAEQIVNVVAGKTLGQVFNAGGGIIELGHDGVEVRLFDSGQHWRRPRRRRVRRPEVNGNKILSHQSGEFDAAWLSVFTTVPG